VEGLHARLVRQEDGSFRLIDQGSVAGTWVNYAEVPEEGQVLQHGDLIHFGRVGFRFTLRLPQNVSKPVTTLQENQK
jgi:predicted component of type VI protein secretion system